MQIRRSFVLFGGVLTAFLLAGEFAPPCAIADSPQDPIASLKNWLAKPAGERANLSDQSFATAPLTKDQSAKARSLLWDDHVQMIHADRKKEWKDLAITIG